MYEKKLQLRHCEPESIVISKEERYELIAQVAKTLEDSRAVSKHEEDMDWFKLEPEFDFESVVSQIN